MLAIATALSAVLPGLLRSRLSLQLEIVALRHQLAIYQRQKRPRIRAEDRAFWVLLSRFWSGWRSAVVLVQPATVVRWQRRRFRDHWRRVTESPKPGRPPIAEEIRRLIRQMSSANPLWGAPRIVGELRKIGIDVAKSTVETYMVRHRGPASPTWKSFLRNHRDLVSADFFVVPTVRFGLLWVFVLVATERRRVLHFNVTSDPTSEWAARQVVQAFPYETAPRFLLRDRDGIYGKEFSRRVQGLGIEEVLTAYRSPWQNGYVERLIGTIRRDCLDHVIVMNARHLQRVLTDYLAYYHRWRTHLSLEMDTPDGRPVQTTGKILEIEDLGGLHHRYVRQAA